MAGPRPYLVYIASAATGPRLDAKDKLQSICRPTAVSKYEIDRIVMKLT